MIYLNQKHCGPRRDDLVTGITTLGNVSSGLCETEAGGYQDKSHKNQWQGQRRIESTSMLVIDIRRGDFYVFDFKEKKIEKSVTHDTKSVTHDTRLIYKGFFEAAQ